MTAVQGSTRARVLDRVKGQPGALRLLRGSLDTPLHAYLFVGPPGTGRRDAAIAFAAALLCPSGGCGQSASCQEALAGRHPDLEVIERAGASILVDQAREVARMALRTPRAGRYQVLVLVDFDLVEKAAPALLKTIEEPPDTTVIILIAETVPRSFVTIASRCVQVQFKPLTDETIVEILLTEGVELRDRDVCRRGRARAPGPGQAAGAGPGLCRATATMENRAEPAGRDRCEGCRARRRVARFGRRAARGGARATGRGAGLPPRGGRAPG